MQKKLQRENSRNKTAEERMTDMILTMHAPLLARYSSVKSELELVGVDVQIAQQPAIANSISWTRKTLDITDITAPK